MGVMHQAACWDSPTVLWACHLPLAVFTQLLCPSGTLPSPAAPSAPASALGPWQPLRWPHVLRRGAVGLAFLSKWMPGGHGCERL